MTSSNTTLDQHMHWHRPRPEDIVIQYTPQEKRILDVLADGKPHTVDELMKCLWDDMAGHSALLVCISAIRRKLAPHEQYIHCIGPRPPHGQSCYVHVQTLSRV